MASNSSAPATTINIDYLNKLATSLQTLLDEVNQVIRIMPSANAATNGSNIWNGNLTVDAGASGFNAAKNLEAAVQNAGNMVHSELTWLQKVLTDTISELHTTAQGMQGADQLNAESVQTLLQDLQGAYNDIQASPTGGSSGSSSGGSGSSGSGSSGSGSSSGGSSGSGSGTGSSSTSSSNG
jgi:hypothetical protein